MMLSGLYPTSQITKEKEKSSPHDSNEGIEISWKKNKKRKLGR
jgi:hypothetical protein